MIKNKVSTALFALAALCFLLPFVSVSSNGAQVAQLSGVHVLRCETLQLPQAEDAGQQQVRIDGDPMAWFAVICVAISLVMSFVATGGLALYPALGGLIGAGALLLMRFTLQSQIAKQANGALQAKYEPGFFAAMLCLVAAAAWSFYLYSRRQPEEDILLPSSAFGSATQFPEELPVLAAVKERAPEASPVAEVHPAGDTVSCTNCGATLNADAKFCTVCGKRTEPSAWKDISKVPGAVISEPVPPPPPVEEAVPVPAEETIICGGCGATLNPDVRFCTVCGRPVSAEASVEAPPSIVPMVATTATLPVIEPPPPPSPVTDIVCSSCGATLNAGSRFCNMCGTPVGTTVAPAEVSKEVPSRTVEPVAPQRADDYAIVKEAAKADYRPYESATSTGVLDTTRRPKKGLPAVAVAVILLVLIVGAAAGWYFWGVNTVVACSPFDAKASLDGVELTPDTPGRFSIPHLARGPHTLKVQRDGYGSTVQTLDFPMTSISEYVNVRLSPLQKTSKPR